MSQKKVILMILNIRFLPDIRVVQEYNALKSAGYRVIIVADMNGQRTDEFEVIRVNPNEGISAKYNLTLRKNPKLKKEIIDELKKVGVTSVDAIHVHDLFWSFIGFELKRYYRAKIVIDLHENYPAMIEDFGWEAPERSLKTYGLIFLSSLKRRNYHRIWNILREKAHHPDRLVKYEQRVLKKCDRLIVVVKEALERFRDYDYYKKGIIVSNTKNPDSWGFGSLPSLRGKTIVTYMGGTQSELRGIGIAISGMKYIDQSLFQLNIVGIKQGTKMHKQYLKIIEENNINNVNLIEWIEDEQEAFKYIQKSHIGIIPHLSTELTETTIPHKLFIYMAMGRPVLASSVAPLKRIIEDTKCGLVFKAGDAQDFAEKLIKMNDIRLLNEFSSNGRRAVENQYNWKHDSERLVGMYRGLIGK